MITYLGVLLYGVFYIIGMYWFVKGWMGNWYMNTKD